MEYEGKIRKSPLFAGIREEELKTLLACAGAKIREYEKRRILALEKDDIRYIGVIVEGTVHMVYEDSEGNRSILCTIREGEVFGESFACGDSSTSHVTFVTGAETVVLFLPYHKILHTCTLACRFHHILIENMVTLIANKNVDLMERAKVMSARTLRQKVLRYLRGVQQREGKQTGQWFTVFYNRTELAEYLGADRTALARELKSMEASGLIRMRKQEFCLTEDPECF